MALVRSSVSIAAGLLLVALNAQAAAGYDLQTYSLPGYTDFSLLGVNNNNTLIATGTLDGRSYGLLIKGASVTQIAGPGGAVGATAFDATDADSAVGNFWTTTWTDPDTGMTMPGAATGYMKNGSGYSTFGLMGGVDVDPRGVSPDGRFVTGYFNDDAGMHGFAFDTSGEKPLQIVGGPNLTIAQGINASGTMVGSERIEDAPGHWTKVGFTYDVLTGARQNYSFAGYVGTNLRDITSDGRLAGWLDTGEVVGGIHRYVGFVGTPDSFQTIEVAGAVDTFVEGINDKGWLVGNYVNADGTGGAFLAMPVPEPTTLALSLGGLLALGALRRRRA